jgi:hypothetical protein
MLLRDIQRHNDESKEKDILMMGMNSKLQDGSIDLGKLMGTVESLCSNIKGADGSSGGGSEIFKIIKQIVPTPQSVGGGDSNNDVSNLLK